MSAEDWPNTIALRTAADLRSAVADLGEQEVAVRQERYNEILVAAEKQLAPQQHPEFYQALARWFPNAPVAQGDSSANGAHPHATHHDAESLKTPAAIFDAIRSVFPTLNAQEKIQFARALADFSGAQPPAPSGITLAQPTLEMLEVPEGVPVNCDRLAPLVGLLIEVLVHLDSVAWGVWDNIEADAKIRKREAETRPIKQVVIMKKAIMALLVGQSRLTIPQLTLQIAQLQRITVELLAQMNQVGKYAVEHMRQISPQSIMLDVKSRGGGILGSLASKCWARYTEVWTEIESGTKSAIDTQVLRKASEIVNGQRF